VSDDTQMTLFTLEALTEAKGAVEGRDGVKLVEAIRRAYLDWLDTQGSKRPKWAPAGRIHQDLRLRKQRAPGTTCLSALISGGRGTPETPINDSKGCGGVMR